MFAVVAFELLVGVVGVAMLLWLTYKGYTQRAAWLAWFGASLCVISATLFFIGFVGEYGIGVHGENARQVGTFVAVLATLGAVTGVAVWYIRRRPASAGAATKQNYVHAYGTYDAATVRAARAKAARTRREVRA